MTKKENQDSLKFVLGIALPIYTNTQIRNLVMRESQGSKTRAKLKVAKDIDDEKESRRGIIKRNYSTTIKAPNWLHIKKKQDEATIPGTIMYMISDYHRPLLCRKEQIIDER